MHGVSSAYAWLRAQVYLFTSLSPLSPASSPNNSVISFFPFLSFISFYFLFWPFLFFIYIFLYYSLSAPLKVVGGSPSLMIASKPIPSDPGPTGLNRTEVRGEGEGRERQGGERGGWGGREEGVFYLIYF